MAEGTSPEIDLVKSTRFQDTVRQKTEKKIVDGLSNDPVKREGKSDLPGKAEQSARDELATVLKNPTARQLVRDLEKEAMTDHLTGLPNRRALEAELARDFESSRRSGQPLGVLFLDVDGFTEVNRTWKHRGGDAALVYFTDVLKSTLREEDFVARLGGDEFVVLCRSADLKSSKAIGERFRESVQDGPLTGTFGLTTTVGAASMTERSQYSS